MNDPLQNQGTQKQVASTKIDSMSNIIKLSDGDDLVLNPEVDKFNLVNQILIEEVNIAMEEAGDGVETSSRIKEQ
jgi:hypothetical protein